MARNLLYEMAVHSENDVFKMNPVASVSTKVTDELEGNELRKYVLQNFQSVEIQPNYKIDEHIVGELISHHCGHRQKKKAALLALPYVINANIVTAPWRRRLGDDGQPVRKNDKRPSGMISAPILIDGIKCLCSLTLRKSKGIITPYTLVLKDENGEIIEGEKMEGTISSVPHSSSKPTAIGDAHSFKATTSHDTNPSFQGAKVEQNIETTKDNNIKTENYTYMKKLIRLTEGDLHRVVKESVDKILKEGYYDDLHDYWGQEDEPNLICPYCESDNVQEVRGKDGSWDGSCRCYDCGKVFDIDSARGNNYFEPDWDAMRHESLKRNGKMLKEMDLNPRMSTHDAYGRGLSRKSEGPNWSRQRRRPMTQQQNLGGVNMDAVNKVLFPDETPQMAKDQLKRRAQYGLMNPPSVKESNLHNIVKESVNKILKEDANVNTEARWSEYERLVDQIRNATQKLYMTTSNQDTNTPSYDETEGRLHRFAEGVLSVLEEFDFVDYGFDPTQHITW